MIILSCPWCGANGKVLYLDDTGMPMFMCLECHLTDNLQRLLEMGLRDRDKMPGGGDE